MRLLRSARKDTPDVFAMEARLKQSHDALSKILTDCHVVCTLLLAKTVQKTPNLNS